MPIKNTPIKPCQWRICRRTTELLIWVFECNGFGKLEEVCGELLVLLKIRNLDARVQPLGITNNPLFKAHIRFVKEQANPARPVPFLVFNRENRSIGPLLYAENFGIVAEIDGLREQKPEWGHLQRIPVGRLQIVILDSEVLAIGYDLQTAWRAVIETHFAGALEVKFATLLLSIGIGLNEGALEVR